MSSPLLCYQLSPKTFTITFNITSPKPKFLHLTSSLSRSIFNLCPRFETHGEQVSHAYVLIENHMYICPSQLKHDCAYVSARGDTINHHQHSKSPSTPKIVSENITWQLKTQSAPGELHDHPSLKKLCMNIQVCTNVGMYPRMFVHV